MSDKPKTELPMITLDARTSFVGEHLWIEQIEKKHETKVYSVISRCDNTPLGLIAWHVPWRQYVFQPTINVTAVWSDGCLKELLDVLTKLREARKK